MSPILSKICFLLTDTESTQIYGDKGEEAVQAVSSAATGAKEWIEKVLIPFIRDYKFLLVILAAVLLVILIVIFAIKHMPSRGRINDVYDSAGNRREGKGVKKSNPEDYGSGYQGDMSLPPEFYKRK